MGNWAGNMIKIYADGSDPEEMIAAHKDDISAGIVISGFTTNPTLMRKSGITNYEQFARQVLQQIPDYPISFEVFADEFPEMERQALKLASLGDNVFVKIPITNTKGEKSHRLIRSLLDQQIKINVTAVFNTGQIHEVLPFIDSETSAVLSIFAGRIADTGRDPKPIVKEALNLATPNMQVLWASCREIYNVYEAANIGCHIITVPNNLLKKLSLRNKDLDDYSLETVKMFYDDAQSSKFIL
jgi:transaldolase